MQDMKTKSKAIDEYLAALSDDKRSALERLRRTIRAAAPRAEECISYQLPAFRLDGKVLVLFGASAGHCAFYPGSGTAVAAHEDELERYKTSKGAIRFQPAKPLPASLVRKLVRYRIAENAAQRNAAALRAIADAERLASQQVEAAAVAPGRKRSGRTSKSKPKTAGTMGTSKPRTPATKSPPRAGTKAVPGASEDRPGEPASRYIDQRTRELGDWREGTLARMRALILEADPGMIEERKWKKPSNAMAGVPVWSHHGIVCTGEVHTKVVKLTFAQGANVPDPSRLFNSSLEGNTRRAIDIREGEMVDSGAFKALVKAAVALNLRRM